jgi:hypothetical protein
VPHCATELFPTVPTQPAPVFRHHVRGSGCPTRRKRRLDPCNVAWQDILTLKTSRCSAFPCMTWLHALSGFGSLAVIGVVLTQFRFEWKIGPVPPSARDDTVLRRDYFQRSGVEREIASRRWGFAKELALTFLPFSCSPSTIRSKQLLVFGSSLGPHPSRRWRDLKAGAVPRDWGTKGSLCWNLEEGRTKPLLSLPRGTRAHRLPTHKVRVGSLPNDHWQWLLGLHHRRPLTISIKGLVASGFCHAEPLSPLEAFLDNQWQDDVRDLRAQSYGLVVEHGFSRRTDVDSIQLP